MLNPSIHREMTIRDLKRQFAQTHSSVGLAGEILVAQYLERSGYSVQILHDKGDLSVVYPNNGQIVGIEVKTARRNTRGAYSFTLRKNWQGRQCCDVRKADIVILLCVMKTGDCYPFVVPVGAIGERRAVAIASYPWQYKGWLSVYRQPLDKLSLPVLDI